jgi:redox-sensing transcriptional repressor
MNPKLLPPQATVKRLSIYLRFLNSLNKDIKMVSSQELAKRLALNPAQVRKDLAYFGDFGKRGVGYSVKKLRDQINKILGLHKTRNIGIVGIGRLGMALACYQGFEKKNFKICALFDKVPKLLSHKIGEATEITDVNLLPKVVKDREIDILILTVPVEAIKEIYDMVLTSGVKAVLNFAPFKLISTENVHVHNVDLSTELEFLSYSLNLNDDPKDNSSEVILGVPSQLL